VVWPECLIKLPFSTNTMMVDVSYVRLKAPNAAHVLDPAGSCFNCRGGRDRHGNNIS
jgi:hypothetical protein